MIKVPGKNTTEIIAASLREDILRGKLASRQPLRQDEIASLFGVSKIPVREALAQLNAEGLVTLIQNRGAFVSSLSADEAEEIYIMRDALEKIALERAIPQLTVSQLTQAEAILDTIDAEENTARWGELNWDFHSTLYSPASLPRLQRSIRNLHINVARYLVLYLEGMDYQRASQDEHRQLLDACRYGDINKSLEILENHLRAASDHLVTFLNDKPSVS
ncbi:MAG: GntR family transcriptional regulator [Anaerolineales bacterium]|jgi:DNA-binding GntR family transcriptional regulator